MRSPSPGPNQVPQALVVGFDRWLRLRWWLAPGQIIAIAAAGPLPPSVSYWLLAFWSLVSALPAIFARLWRGKDNARTVLGVVILGDMVLLTLALAVCGGASNPFSVLYLVHVTLACALVGPTLGWISVAVAAGLYAGLFLLLPGMPQGQHEPMHGPTPDLRQHLWSMYFAFVAVALLVVAFVSSVTRTLRMREADLADARARAERNARLANITVLAAGTAHEMGTPLATIAVTAKEMERAAIDVDKEEWAEDARLIRSEVERCRRLLDELRGQAGAVEGEAPTSMQLGEAMLAATAHLPEASRRRVSMAPGAEAVRLFLPRAAFVQVLVNLVRNALEASPADEPIVIDAAARADLITIRVCDRGHGMDESTLIRAREPFFTTKPPGKGLGLGLFLADRFVREVGGELVLSSQPGQGTEVRLELPA